MLNLILIKLFQVASTSQLAKDIGLARKLWELSQKVVGLNPEEMYC